MKNCKHYNKEGRPIHGGECMCCKKFNECYNKDNYEPIEEASETKEDKSILERERRECEYIMKKMACESRKDNDWRPYGFNIEYGSFEIRYNFATTKIVIIRIGLSQEGIDFNCIRFNTEGSAQQCLDHLIEKYTEPRLKEIWGIK